eukprot:TRINITY_DN62227_c0_g1_i1.p1 TRINITY_DN62227_c0_g1~~TRINITY_DN62227_c0_g1_i1.p1  ORF type:complete len:455 (-),score=82.09 TRINITY_DN62227_c0_g1_i1:14-1378(-)
MSALVARDWSAAPIPAKGAGVGQLSSCGESPLAGLDPRPTTARQLGELSMSPSQVSMCVAAPAGVASMPAKILSPTRFHRVLLAGVPDLKSVEERKMDYIGRLREGLRCGDRLIDAAAVNQKAVLHQDAQWAMQRYSADVDRNIDRFRSAIGGLPPSLVAQAMEEYSRGPDDQTVERDKARFAAELDKQAHEAHLQIDYQANEQRRRLHRDVEDLKLRHCQQLDHVVAQIRRQVDMQTRQQHFQVHPAAYQHKSMVPDCMFHSPPRGLHEAGREQMFTYRRQLEEAAASILAGIDRCSSEQHIHVRQALCQAKSSLEQQACQLQVELLAKRMHGKQLENQTCMQRQMEVQFQRLAHDQRLIYGRMLEKVTGQAAHSVSELAKQQHLQLREVVCDWHTLLEVQACDASTKYLQRDMLGRLAENEAAQARNAARYVATPPGRPLMGHAHRAAVPCG